jgi:hypothetical protein
VEDGAVNALNPVFKLVKFLIPFLLDLGTLRIRMSIPLKRGIKETGVFG